MIHFLQLKKTDFIANDTFFNHNCTSYQQQQSNTMGSQQNSYRQQATNYQRYPQKSGYTPNIQQRDINLKRRRNPCTRNGVQLCCNICESIYHFKQECPEVRTTDLYLTHEVILFESDYDHPAKLKNLVSDSWNAALLDSGATKTVAEEILLNSFIQSLNEEEKGKIETSKSNNMYRFGDRNLIPAILNVNLPVTIAEKQVYINTDIMPNDIPLLLSRQAMKKTGMSINSEKDQAIVFRRHEKLITTSSGHYALPITSYCKLINNVNAGSNENILLVNKNQKSKRAIALKLHRQFTHPTPDKLVKLLNSAGQPWNEDQQLEDLINDISNECKFIADLHLDQLLGYLLLLLFKNVLRWT